MTPVMDPRFPRWRYLRLAITGFLVACSFLWFLSQLPRDPLTRWVTVGDWLLEIGLVWLLVWLLTSIRWLRQRAAIYLLALALVFFLFVDHFLVHNMYPGATYRMAAAALAAGTGIVGLASAWFLERMPGGASGRQIRSGAILLCSLALLMAAVGERILPIADRWHPFGG
jgi:hypothetical protein